jgi:hypothetical protein
MVRHVFFIICLLSSSVLVVNVIVVFNCTWLRVRVLDADCAGPFKETLGFGTEARLVMLGWPGGRAALRVK